VAALVVRLCVRAVVVCVYSLRRAHRLKQASHAQRGGAGSRRERECAQCQHLMCRLVCTNGRGRWLGWMIALAFLWPGCSVGTATPRVHNVSDELEEPWLKTSVPPRRLPADKLMLAQREVY